jgi:integrase
VLASWKGKEPAARLAILAQVVTGIRFSELRALEKRDLDLKTPGLWIRRSMARKTVGTPKNKRARFQVIPRGLADELREWMLRTDGQLLFPGKAGGPLANNSLNRIYRARHPSHDRFYLRLRRRQPENDRHPARPRAYRLDRTVHAPPGRPDPATCGGAVGEVG